MQGGVRAAGIEAVECSDPNGVSHRSMLPAQSTYSTKNAPRLGKAYRSPSPTWTAFLNNHVRDLVSIDFFLVPTVRNKVQVICDQ
jgi:hypothetical protein